MYSIKAHFLYFSCRNVKFREYPRMEWPITPTVMDPPATSSRKVMRCHCSSQSMQLKPNGTWEGSKQIPSTQRILSQYLLASGKMHAQKQFWYNWFICIHPLCSPRGRSIWYVVQRALIILEQRDKMEFQSSGCLMNLPSAAVSKTSFHVQHWVTGNSLAQVALCRR